MALRPAHKNCLLSLSSIIVFFLVLEALLALFRPHKITTHQYHEQYHPVMGWVNKPTMEGKVRLARNENIYFHRKHNSKGLRSSREFDYEKPPGVRRILLIGDSFFWGFCVDDRSVVSEALQRRLGPGYEVINGAVTGYGTDQELLWLAEEGFKYQPDIVILGTFPANDLDEIANSVMYGYPKPFFSYSGNKLSLMNVPVPDTRETRRKGFEQPDTLFGRLKKLLRHNSHAYQLIVSRLNSVPSIRAFFLKTGLADEFTRALPGVIAYKLKPDKAYELYDALIKEMKIIAGESRAAFLLVFIPGKEQDPGKPIGYEGLEDGTYDDNTREARGLAAFAKKNRIPFLDLLPVVRRHHLNGDHLYTSGAYDHHWNQKGHEIAAEAIISWLNDKGWGDAPKAQPAGPSSR